MIILAKIIRIKKALLILFLGLIVFNGNSQNPEQWIFTASSYRVDIYNPKTEELAGMGWNEMDEKNFNFLFSEKSVSINGKTFNVLDRKMLEETVEKTIYSYSTTKSDSYVTPNSENFCTINIWLVKSGILIIVYDKYNFEGEALRVTTYTCSKKRK